MELAWERNGPHDLGVGSHGLDRFAQFTVRVVQMLHGSLQPFAGLSSGEDLFLEIRQAVLLVPVELVLFLAPLAERFIRASHCLCQLFVELDEGVVQKTNKLFWVASHLLSDLAKTVDPRAHREKRKGLRLLRERIDLMQPHLIAPLLSSEIVLLIKLNEDCNLRLISQIGVADLPFGNLQGCGEIEARLPEVIPQLLVPHLESLRTAS
mmetsp:Transcript_51030/g.110721  ORF Transcript_51030/g.110721 Transcript_51030/m.110721 type:complete len:209 (+) Transcript_51030:403-1029(+)